MRKTLIVLIMLGISGSMLAQTSREFFVGPNVNLYFPMNSEKGVFPIIGYDKETKPKLLIGGFGVGVSAFQELNEQWKLKAQANISKHAYWNEAVNFRSVNNQDLGNYGFSSNDYTLGITGAFHYSVTRRFSVGTGLGAQFMLISVTPNPLGAFSGNEDAKPVFNRHYKPFMPVVPLEFSLKFEKTFYCIRYEQALLNKFKGDLAKREKESYGLVYFEVGFKI